MGQLEAAKERWARAGGPGMPGVGGAEHRVAIAVMERLALAGRLQDEDGAAMREHGLFLNWAASTTGGDPALLASAEPVELARQMRLIATPTPAVEHEEVPI